MFERLNERARRVVFLAQEEARVLRHDQIGTEHILLALFQEEEGPAAWALESLEISPKAMRQQVEELTGRGSQALSGHISFTPRARTVLDRSLQESIRLGHDYIGTEHLLLSVLLESDGLPAQLLRRFGADPARMAEQLRVLLVSGPRDSDSETMQAVSTAAATGGETTSSLSGYQANGAWAPWYAAQDGHPAHRDSRPDKRAGATPHRPTRQHTAGVQGDSELGRIEAPAGGADEAVNIIPPTLRYYALQSKQSSIGSARIIGSDAEFRRQIASSSFLSVDDNRTWFAISICLSIAYAAWVFQSYVSGALGRSSKVIFLLLILILAAILLGIAATQFGRIRDNALAAWAALSPAAKALVSLGYLLGVLILPIGLAFLLGVLAVGLPRLTFMLAHLSSYGLTPRALVLLITPYCFLIAYGAYGVSYLIFSISAFSADRWLKLSQARIDEVDFPRFEKSMRRLAAVEPKPAAKAMLNLAVTRPWVAWLLRGCEVGEESWIDHAAAKVREATARYLSSFDRGSDDWARYEMLDVLAQMLWLRYWRVYALGALSEAILVREQCRELRLDRGYVASNKFRLAELLGQRFALTGSEIDLRNALELARGAAGTRDDVADGTVMLIRGNLERAFFEWELTRSASAVEGMHGNADAEKAFANAMDAYDKGAALGTAACRYNQCLLLMDRYLLLGETASRARALRDLRKIAQIAGTAQNDADPDPEDRARSMLALACALVLTGEPSLVTEAVTWLKSATAVSGAPPTLRLAAAYGWGHYAKDAAEAAAGFSCALELMPQLAWPGVGAAAQERILADWPELSVDAAAAHIAAGDHLRAVEFLEHGRVLMWSQRIAVQSAPLYRLRETDPRLFTRLSALQAQLSIPDIGPRAGSTTVNEANQAAERRTALYREWEAAISQAGLTQTPRYIEIREAAAGGPVIILNASKYRCDALIVCAEGPVRHLDLPGGIYAKAWEAVVAGQRTDRARRLVQERQAEIGSARTAEDELNGRKGLQEARNTLGRAMIAERQLYLATLKWLWTDIAESVIRLLEAEKLLTSANDDLPRVWWCPTGCLSFLPIHEAGVDNEPGSSVIERVVSSYVVTLSQLVRARQQARQHRAHGIIIVAPAPDLAFAKPEAELIASYFDDYKLLDGDSANAEALTREIANYPCLHFAGHGAAAQRDTKAGLSFAGGLQIAGEGKPTFLSARAISDLPVADGEFAFLSVCDAATPDVSLLDEAMHPAAVLHFSGYRHVIGTLQPVIDAQAPAVADAVYARLVTAGRLDAAESARALHHVLMQLRHDADGKPGPWGSYIHLGP